MTTAGRWGKGYTQPELDRAQARFGLTFPPDLIALLREKRLPDGHDWNDETAIRQALAWPLEGLLFDIEHDQLWWPEWGEKPESMEARTDILRSVVARAPKLIPLRGHRYLPAEPNEPGNPVFSVHQSDVICYGTDLADYLEREFNDWNYRPGPERIKHIPFWSDLVERY